MKGSGHNHSMSNFRHFFRAQFASFLACDLHICCKTLSRFFNAVFPSFYSEELALYLKI